MASICLLFLHGSGGDGGELTDYLRVVPLADFNHEPFMDIAKSLRIDVVAPTAPSRRYTPLGGERCTVWYDRSADFMRRGMDDVEDQAGVDASLSTIMTTASSAKLSGYKHLFVGGFSMGGGLALHALRRNGPSNLRGIFSMGSFAVQNSALVTQPLGTNGQLPLLMMHGEADQMISCEWGRQTAANLLLRDVDVQFRSYKRVGHEMDPTQLADLLLWVQDIVTQTETLQREQATLERAEGKDNNAEEEKEGGFTASRREAKGSAAKGKEGELSPERGRLPATADRAPAIQYTIEPAYTVSHSGGSGDASSSGKGGGGGGGSATAVSPQWRVRFSVPEELISVVAGRPVLACGSMFDVLEDRQGGGVQVVLESSDPHSTAQQIGVRLQARISGGSAGLNPCPVS